MEKEEISTEANIEPQDTEREIGSTLEGTQVETIMTTTTTRINKDTPLPTHQHSGTNKSHSRTLTTTELTKREVPLQIEEIGLIEATTKIITKREGMNTTIEAEIHVEDRSSAKIAPIYRTIQQTNVGVM